VRQQPAAAFYDEWRREADGFAEWVGELYLERHQGTLTTQGRMKRFNRLLELGLRELEWVATLAGVVAGAPYPEDWLGRAWREVLLYQFHDILPGSSIGRVYDEALPRYEALYHELRELLVEYDRRLAAAVDTVGLQAPFIVQNSLPWPRSDWVRLGDTWHEVHVPAAGYRVVDGADLGDVADGGAEDGGGVPDDAAAAPRAAPGTTAPAVGAPTAAPRPAPRSYVEAAPERLENDVLRVAFAADGSIASLIDKRLGRDLITPGGAGNVLAVYTDTGDVWDFPTDYHDQEPRRPELVATEARVDGARGLVRQTYRIGHSDIVQNIALMANGARLDFRTTVRWREPWTMLRTSFAVTPRAEEATFEIQFGHIRRPTHVNTSWDVARTEVAAHKWADLSQGDYGVALLNDSKYGHRIKEGVIDLNLLRSVKYPGEVAPAGEEQASDEPNPHFTDQAEHRFTYSLFPHAGDHVDGRVVQAAYELNVPLRATALDVAAGGATAGTLPATASFIELDADNVVVETVKRAEDDDDVILRLYEAHRRGATAHLRLGFEVTAAAETDLLEGQPAPLAVEDGRLLTLAFRPFEIKTVRLTPA
jgi:alpha-mannosidase